jgi:SAM-dependent methyltransferase
MADKPPVALETRSGDDDGRRYSPSVARNREPIRDVLSRLVPSPASILEVASGTGEHGAFFTASLEGLEWTYSDIDPESLASQAAWQSLDETGRLHGPLTIDASADDWLAAETTEGWDAIFSANMVHIAPWSAATGLFRGAGRLLKPGGQLILYGPFARNGVIAPSNAAFAESLKSRNPDWGVRDLDRDMIPLAEAAGLTLQGVTEMPANNLTVSFRKPA